MHHSFVNRSRELAELDKLTQKAGLIVFFGRRRVGKTRLLTHWIEKNGGLYSQVIQSNPQSQLKQIFEDILPQLKTSIQPKTWSEFFEILELQDRPLTLCIDEFPYLVEYDESVPSIFQKWLDHRKKQNVTLILTGSSHHMMHDLFLNRSAALYGRALKVIHVEPMDYTAFCKAKSIRPESEKSFQLYSLVGGIPKYWEFIEPESTPIQAAENLFFGFAPYMENEPEKILQDESANTLTSKSILEAIGRGAHRPSEISKVLQVQQTNLSRPIQKLTDSSLIQREVPFGESARNSKKSLYKITDPALRFWYSIYSPHRTRWQTYSESQKALLIRQHSSTLFEDYCRNLFEGASRYWENDVEFDFIRPSFTSGKEQWTVVEVKFKTTTKREQAEILSKLATQWQKTELFKKNPQPDFEVLDVSILSKGPVRT